MTSPRLADLVTVMFQPRTTMRRILDGGPDRWTVQIVLLAFLCASVSDLDIRRVAAIFPNLGLSLIAIAAIALMVGAAIWVLALFCLSWLTTMAGRLLGGTGTVSDVRAACAWGMVPIIWSVIYRAPAAFFQRQFNLQEDTGMRELLDFVAQGGCSIIVIILALQLFFFLWSLFVASCCVGEAHGFSTQKGFASLAIVIAAPVLVIAALVFAFARS